MAEITSAVAALESPQSSSGILRLEVPIKQRSEAVAWLHSQQSLPYVFFSGRGDRTSSDLSRSDGSNIVNVAGVGSAVTFRQSEPFSFDDWRSIRRFLSADSPFIRAYGALRFDASSKVSPEWEDFGSFYFSIPQVEFNELEESSKLAVNVAWDDRLQWPWEKAMTRLHDTISRISPSMTEMPLQVPRSNILSRSHKPMKLHWDVAIEKALHMIRKEDSELKKVVLARSTRIMTDSDIDPIELLARLQMEGQPAYQFCIKPDGGPAFIGNTPEQLFRRENSRVWSEALAATRRRGKTEMEDLKIRQDLLLSPKDDLEFSIVRERIKTKLESICEEVCMESSKEVRKLKRVQHLYARLSGKLKHEEDEFYILSHLHPTPAVCGLPTEDARRFIAENEAFDRGMYAGPVGWFGGNEAEFAVGIRSALVGKGLGALIYAGAGIVEGTVSSSEWEEVELKGSQFTKLLQGAEIGEFQPSPASRLDRQLVL